MPEIEATAFVNLVIVTLVFSLLIIGIGLKFEDVKILTAWADAKSFANAVATRFVSSADCFAYETLSYYYDPENHRTVIQRHVHPGIIDVRKFVEDRYIDCVEAYYHSSTSELPALRLPAGKGVKIIYFLETALVDLEDPYKLRDRMILSTKERLNNTEGVKRVEGFVNWIHSLGWILDVICTTASIAASAVTFTVGMLSVSISPTLKILEAQKYSTLDENLIDLVLEQGSKYTLRIPVRIKYFDEDREVADHAGVLEVTFYYFAPESYGKLFEVFT